VFVLVLMIASSRVLPAQADCQPNETIIASREVAEMIRELFIAFVVLSLTVTVAAWFGSGPRLSVQQVEANLGR
jgi:hypothetical protein